MIPSIQTHGPLEAYTIQAAMTGDRPMWTAPEDSKHFLPGTQIPVSRPGFVFNNAGMGDYICFLPAMKWIAENCPWVHPTLFCPPYLIEMVENVMRAHLKTWTILPNDLETTNAAYASGRLDYLKAPGVEVNTSKGSFKMLQLANGTGGHLVDVGFLYFANKFPVPPGADKYPNLDFDHWFEKQKGMSNSCLPKKYVVLAPGGVSAARTVPGHLWNPIIKYLRELGGAVVILGKSEMSKDLKVKWPEGIDLDSCWNLWDRTTPMQAAWIMKNAAMTIGLDNGLIQLASCTDANIICAYNIVHPNERRPNREGHGIWIELTLQDKELACIHCQSKNKLLWPHNFQHCIYGHKACIDLLFANDGARFKTAIDCVLHS